MPPTAAVAFDAVDFAHHRALRGFEALSFELPQGATVGIVGRSGAGKSTLLSLIGGHVRPRSGRIRILGEDVTERGAGERPTATVFQSHWLFPHLNVLQNVRFGAKGSPSESQGKAMALLALLGLTELCERRPNELSGGEAQRVALARALATDPAVLLLDEPFASLDEATRDEARGAVSAAIATARGTSIMVSHDFSEVARSCTVCMVVSEFRVVAIAPPRELLVRPTAPEVVDAIPGFITLSDGTHCHQSLLSIRTRPLESSVLYEAVVCGQFSDQHGSATVVRIGQTLADVRHGSRSAFAVGQKVWVECDLSDEMR